MGKDNIEIRIAMGKDKQKVVDLWRYSFQDTEAFVEYYFSKRFLPENTMLLENNEKLEAALQMNPYNLVIGDVICEASYIVGVSVQPESRGLGYMNQLLTKTLNYQYQNGEEFSILMPIDTRIYTKYGYANCFMKHEFTVELSRIVYQKPVYKIRRIDITSAENLERDIHRLNEIYYNVAARHHSFVSRNSRYWKNRFGELEIENAQLFVVYDQLTPKGYMILLPQSTDGTGLVVEMAFLDATAFQDLMGLLKGHSTQFQQAVISTPQYVEFDMMTQFDNKIKHSVKPFMMGRVIDGEKILDNILYKPQIFGDKLGFSPEENVEYSIGLTDDVIPENNFVMYCLNGKIQSVNRQKTKEPLALHLELNVSELAQIYTKAYTVRQLLELRNAPNQEEQIQFFERIFGKEIQQNYINDYI